MAEDFLTRQRYDGDLNDILGFEELLITFYKYTK